MKTTYAKNTSGFTIVELLIVIVVIAILATVSIVAYNGIQDRANDTAVKSDLANMAKKAQLHQVEKGTYPSNNSPAMKDLGFRITKNAYDTNGYNLYYCTDQGTNSKFAFAAKSKSGNSFFVSSNGSGDLGGGLTMSGSRACDQIGVAVTGNITYGYNLSISEWRDWEG